ncbi:uncharacterized protein METZ01_LOCUS79808 [marine metagenome]|uniref:Uncharacterized protein n=1 Tax=marine metagenome TaxID=408172 RepID=A0A381UG40_9ZZZZ
MTHIIKDIENLKMKYHNPHNQYKYRIKVSEDDFKKYMESFLKQEKWDNIEIIDGKYYYENDTILEIFEDGMMNAYYIKKFKYINYNENQKLTLYNQKKIQVDDFHFKQDYRKILIMKKIILKKNNNRYEFNVSIDEKKNQNFIINCITISRNNIKDFNDILGKFLK